MKFISALIVAFISLSICNAQVAYYDAAELTKLVAADGKFPSPGICDPNPDLASDNCKKFAQVMNLIKPYLSPSLRDATPNTIVLSLIDPNDPNYNPFLEPFLKSISFSDGGETVKSLAGNLASLTTTGLGGIDVTTFTQGLAEFLVERAKEELNVAFFQRLKTILDTYPEFNVLFPHTKTFVNNYETWQYANLLATLREAFDKDLAALPANAVKLRDLTPNDCPIYLKKTACDNCKGRMEDLSDFFKTDEGIVLLTVLQLGNAFNSGAKIPDAFSSVITDDFLLGLNFGGRPQVRTNFGSVLRLLNVISLSLRSNEVSRQYISSNEFALLFVPMSNNNLQKIYLGLIYQQILNAQIVINGTNLAQVMRDAKNDTGKIITYLKQVQTLANNLQDAYDTLLKEIREAKDDLSKGRMAFYSAATKLISGITNLELIDARFSLPREVSEFVALTGKAIQIEQDIQAKNYSAALIEILTLIEQQIDSYRKHQNDYTLLPQLQGFTGALMKYGSFASNVVTAKTPDEVKKAIKTIALPAGSASIKKNTNFSVSLNAYVGFVYGFDHNKTVTATLANGTTQEVRLNGNRALAVYAPVGIAVNWALTNRHKPVNKQQHPWSLSLFVSAIDVGAMVGYRFTNDSTYKDIPKIKLENIFAPGFNIVVGLPSVPISLGVGYQRVGMLDRNPGTNLVSTTTYAGWRPQVFLAVDIPILNLATGKKTLLSTTKK